MENILNYIGGRSVPPEADQWLDCYEPATGKVYAHIPDSDASDVNRAVEAAKKAFPEWSGSQVSERSDLMLKLADLMERDLLKLAAAESKDNGKPVSLATKVDIPRAIANIRFFATAILHFNSEAHLMGDIAVNYTDRSPIGTVGCISPWNLPLYLFTWKIAPALATGNCVIAKPSEVTPMSAYLFSELCQEAGFPPGVLNIIHGLGPKVGAAITEHPSISAISFTGGTRTGAEIARVAAPMFKKLSLELGGKNPNIIFEDHLDEEMLDTTVRSSFSNQGQICLCGSRILVQESIYEAFIERFIEKVRLLKVGDPKDPETSLGALVSEAHMNKVLEHIAIAKEEGGIVLHGGERVFPEGELKNGWYVQPTVIAGLDEHCRTNQEEIFGPVVSIISFSNEEDAIAKANSTVYGLASSVWTKDIKRALRVARKIHSGIVWVNCWMVRDLRTPFGGVKQSGVGREGGEEALRFFTEPKNVCLKL
jgi:aminomuconate-semialdehyde/2-hydroxymuconate-6-semialdehyde dehydrogenase